MSTKDTLAVLVDIAAKLEAEGAEILSAGFNTRTGAHVTLRAPRRAELAKKRTLPHWRSGEYTDYGYSEFSYTEGGVRVNWLAGCDALVPVKENAE